jgi:hypothetical protein
MDVMLSVTSDECSWTTHRSITGTSCRACGMERGTVVFQLRVPGPAAFVYRATRVPSMYGS